MANYETTITNEQITVTLAGVGGAGSAGRSVDNVSVVGGELIFEMSDNNDINVGDLLVALGVTSTNTELNILDGVTATTAEINYLSGVTSNIQTQLDSKVGASHNHTVSQITDFASNLAGTTNTSVFTPTSDYHVATKKYVDDAVVAGGGYTDEEAQDAIGTILSSEFVYNDVAGSIALNPANVRTSLGIEAGATADQTGAEIKALYEGEANTNAFTDTEKSKLGLIEDNATADQTGAEIKALYEAELNTNAFTDTEKTKLAGISDDADVTDFTTVQAAGALMDSEVTNLAQVKAFNSADYATAAQGTLAASAVQPGDDANTLGSGAATDGFVLTADGLGNAAWEAASGGGASALSDLTDVDASVATPSDGDILVYRNAGSDWVLEAKPAAGSNPAIADITDWPVGVVAAEVGYLDGLSGNIQSQLDSKASLASPTLTGTPTAPTAATGTNTTQLATTAFVQANIADQYTAADVLTKLLTVDGATSGLDADLLDGQHGAHYLDRTNHTGTQAISTVTGLQTALDGKTDTGHTHTVANITDFASNLAGTTNTSAFTPTGDYHVATKKYVDDAIVGGGSYTDEQAQDAVGTILSADFTYDDVGNAITINAGTLRTTLNVADGADVTDFTSVQAAGALMDSEVTNLADVKAFNPADYATAAQGALADTALQPVETAHRYWRVRGLTCGNANYIGIADLQFRETVGGADIATTGFAIDGSNFGASFTGDKAFDADADTTYWLTAKSNIPADSWVGQDFGAANDKVIREIVIKARVDGANFNQTPDTWVLEYSDDGTNWTTKYSGTSAAWSSGSSQTFEVTNSPLFTTDIGSTVQGYSAVLDATTASFTTADETKLDFITVTGAVNLDTMDTLVGTALQPAAIGSTVQAWSAVLDGTTASFTTADETKLDFITVTQAVDLDTMESDIATNNAKVSNATHTGEVTGSTALTIASDVVTADKLAVTGNGTATQYLRSDGDGTFTWDTPAGGGSGGFNVITKTNVDDGFTAADLDYILADTSTAGFTVNLPLTPATGAMVIVQDSADTWVSNNLTVGRNGQTIEGVAQDLVCDVSNVTVRLVFNGTTWITEQTANGLFQASANTAFLDVAQTFTAAQTFSAEFITPGYEITYATSITIDPANGMNQRVTMAGNVTTATYSIDDGEGVKLTILASNTGTFDFTGVTWVNNAKAAPTLSADPVVVCLWKENTTLYGAVVGDGT